MSLMALTGQCLGFLRCHRAAVRFFTWAATVAPKQRAVFLAERGMSNARLGQRDLAVRDVNEAIRLAPENPFFLLYMAWVHEELSLIRDAIVFYEHAAASASQEFSDSMRHSIALRVAELRSGLEGQTK